MQGSALQKYNILTSLGLPAVQASRSVAADAERAGNFKCPAGPTHIYATLKIKEGADMAALEEGLKKYSAASKASAGKVTCSYSIAQGEVQFIEVYDSPNAMDVHIGNCFPYYITMLPHADMAELICVVEPTELEFWTGSASAWGASKFVVTPAV